MNLRAVITFIAIWMVIGWSGTDSPGAHQDPCHRLHSCPSDHGTYVCGDQGRCDQCPDNAYCVARQPRVTSAMLSPPVPANSAPESIAALPASADAMILSSDSSGMPGSM